MLITSIVGCTWVKPLENSESVALLEETNRYGCERIAVTTVNTRRRVGLITRHRKKVARELIQLARNEAQRSGANAISPSADMTEEGSQEFGLFQCDDL